MSATDIVFGGAGFIGSHLLKKLATQNRRELISVDIRQPKIPVDGVTYLSGDVRNLSKLEIEGDIGDIYNLAAIHTTPGHCTHEYYETNVLGATEITAFARRNRANSIVFTSSISIYGPAEETKSEASPPNPESAYGWSKWLAEGIHRSWLEEDSQRRLVICRPAVIFGPKEGGNFVRLAKLLRTGFFVYPGRKDTIKGCFYVEDLVETLLYAVSLKQHYILFNGCFPDRYTLEQIVDALRKTHFPKAKTFMLPRFFVLALAKAMMPFHAAGIGIHPDRVMKLVRSTDIEPRWLMSQGVAKPGMLNNAIERWAVGSGHKFD